MPASAPTPHPFAAADGHRVTHTGAAPTTACELDSEAVLGGQRRRVIVHQGERYCLQITRAGKLLLTK